MWICLWIMGIWGHLSKPQAIDKAPICHNTHYPTPCLVLVTIHAPLVPLSIHKHGLLEPRF